MPPKKLLFSILILSIFQSILYTSDASNRTRHICLPHLLLFSHPHLSHYQKFHFQHNGFNVQVEKQSNTLQKKENS